MVDFQRGSKVQLVAANGSDDLIIAAAKNSTQFDVGKQKEKKTDKPKKKIHKPKNQSTKTIFKG